MPHAIEMFFDPASDARIRDIWRELAPLSSPSMMELGSRPHVSLAVCDSADIPAVCRLLDRFAESTAPFPILLSSLGLFAAADPIAYLAPKVTRGLLSFHADFFAEFETVTSNCWPHYDPCRWLPHCTLATGILPQDLGPVFEICRAAHLPIECTVTEIGLVEFRPVKQLHAAPLSGAAASDQIP